MNAAPVFLLILTICSSGMNITREYAISEAKKIIAEQKPCENLTDMEMVFIGEYYMEKMFPGRYHTSLTESPLNVNNLNESLQLHINFARKYYCGEEDINVFQFSEPEENEVLLYFFAFLFIMVLLYLFYVKILKPIRII